MAHGSHRLAPFGGTSNLVGSPDMSGYETRSPIQWHLMRRGGLVGFDAYGHQYIIKRSPIPGNREAAVITLAIRGVIALVWQSRSTRRAKLAATRMYGAHLKERS